MSETKNSITVKKAVFYTAVGKYSTIFTQTIFSMILSRLLTPTEFGTVAVVSVFIAFFGLLSDLGLGAGVIQNKDLSSEDENNIFSVSIYIGFGLMCLFLALTFPIVHLYSDKIYYNLCPILALSVLFNSFNMIPNSKMLKEKRFLSIAMRSFVTCCISSVVSIGLAFQGWGVYALCLSQVMSSLSIFIWNEGTAKLKFRFVPDITPVKKIWGYSFYQFSSQTINFFCRNLDNLIIGYIFPKAQLAYYNKSYNLMMMPISNIPGVITPVLHPILSEYQNDRYAIYTRYMKVVQLVSVIGSLISAVCFVYGDLIILIMFGSQWGEAVLPFRILSISILPQLLTNTVGPIYQSAGDTKNMFRSVVICSALILSGITLGAILGSIITVAICVSVVYTINLILSFFILIKLVFKLSVLKFFKTLLPEIAFVSVVIVMSLSIENIDSKKIYQTILLIIFTIIYMKPIGRYKFLKSVIKK